jgi:Domain of unknown function (DUF4124)
MAFKSLLFISCVLCLGVTQVASAEGSAKKLYRWVDSHGHVHYGDTLPVDAGISGSTELGKTGEVMKHSESLAERKARLAAEAEAARIQKEKDEQNRLDQALLGTYTSETEIDLARDRALEFHQLAIKSAQTRITQVIMNQKEVSARSDVIIRRGRSMPAYVQNQIDANQTELDSLNRIIKANQEALVDVKEKYDADKRRFRELTGH